MAALETKLSLALAGYSCDKVGVFSFIVGLDESVVRNILSVPLVENELGLDTLDKTMLNQAVDVLANDVNSIQTPNPEVVGNALKRAAMAAGLTKLNREKFNNLVQYIIQNWEEFRMIHNVPKDHNPEGDQDELANRLAAVPKLSRPPAQ
jgi:hypothetical protein